MKQLQPMGYYFSCACCEVTEVRRESTVPAHRAVEEVGEDTYVFCPECALDLPPAQQ